MTKEFKEESRIWIDYPDVHLHALSLFTSIQEKTPGGAILIAVGRGGWIPTRIVGASFEEANIRFASFSITSAYRKLGAPDEYVDIVQGLSDESLNAIRQLLREGLSLWIIDGPYHTGRAVGAVKTYLEHQLDATKTLAKIHIGVLEWVRYKKAIDCPWRAQASLYPDGYGVKIQFENKPYIEYPWEYSSLAVFRNHHL